MTSSHHPTQESHPHCLNSTRQWRNCTSRHVNAEYNRQTYRTHTAAPHGRSTLKSFGHRKQAKPVCPQVALGGAPDAPSTGAPPRQQRREGATPPRQHHFQQLRHTVMGTALKRRPTANVLCLQGLSSAYYPLTSLAGFQCMSRPTQTHVHAYLVQGCPWMLRLLRVRRVRPAQS